MPGSFPQVRVIIVMVSVLLLVTGCVRSVEPDVSGLVLRDEIERRSLQQAQRAFLRAEYATTVQLLNGFLRTHPDSSRSLEARWWLARAYQKTGRLSSALEHLRVLAGTPDWNVYQADARYRAAQLETRLGQPPAGRDGKGMRLSLDSLQTPGDVDRALSASREIAGNTILLDVPCRAGEDSPDGGESDSVHAMRAAVERMHAQEKAVYLGVTLRCLGQFAREPESDKWKDWAYDPSSGTVRRSSWYSLHRREYQAFLVDWLARLHDLPLAGVVIRNAEPSGVYEGVNPLAVQVFARQFGVDFDPVRTFNAGRTVRQADAGSGVQLPSVFWKWAGWKARERLRIIQSLIRTLRVRLPHLEFGMTVHPQSVTDPVRGLMHFAEDWIDAARGPFDMFVIRVEGAEVVHAVAQESSPESSEQNAVVTAVAEMAAHLGKPDKIWTIMALRSGSAYSPPPALPHGVGRLYEHPAVP